MFHIPSDPNFKIYGDICLKKGTLHFVSGKNYRISTHPNTLGKDGTKGANT